MSRGKYIARIDADDMCLADRLEKQNKYLDDNPDCALISSWVEVIDEDGKKIDVLKRLNKYFYYILAFSNSIAHSSVMFRKDMINSIGCYNEKYKYTQDYELWSRVARKYRIAKLDEPLATFRIKKQAISIKYWREQQNNAIEIMENNFYYYTGKKFDIKKQYLECYMGECKSILMLNNIDEIVECIKILLIVNKAILKKNNLNRNKQYIREIGSMRISNIINALEKRNNINKIELYLRCCKYFLYNSIFVFHLIKNYKKDLIRFFLNKINGKIKWTLKKLLK